MSDTILDIHNRSITVEQAMLESAIKSFIQRFGVWVITDFGLECLVTPYSIKASDLFNYDWLSHMKDKRWVNIDDFTHAYDFACGHHNQERVDSDKAITSKV
jgi:hypothetical protein